MADSLCDLSGGEIRSAPLAAILVEALRQRATGELRVDARGGTSRVYFRGGLPCGAQIFFGFKPLGQFLLELGWIDIDALERSLAAVVDGRKQGEALVELGYLTREKLHQGLGLHHQRHIRNLASVGEGTYAFVPLPELPAWTDALRLSAHRAILDALAAEPGRAVCQRILRRVPTGLGLRLRTGWERFTTHFQFDEAEQLFVSGLDRPRAVDAACRGGEIPEDRALALLAALHLMGILVPSPLGDEAPWATPGPVAMATPGPVPAGARSPGLQQGAIPGALRGVPRQPPAGMGQPVPITSFSLGPANAVVAARPVPPPGGRPLELDFGPDLGMEAPGDWSAQLAEPEPDVEVDLEEAAPEVGFAAAFHGTNGFTPGGVAAEREAPQRPGAAPAPVFAPEAVTVIGRPASQAPRAPEAEVGAAFSPGAAVGGTSPGPGLGAAERAAIERQQQAAQEEARRIRAEREEAARQAREAALRQPPPSFKSDENEAKARRARMLQRAVGNLMGAAEPAAPQGPAAATPGPAAPTTWSWETLPPAGDPAFERFVRDRLAQAPQEDLFARLLLPRGATRDSIKQAFFTAAKRLHPDRIPSAIAHLAPQLKELFGLVNDAYQLLQDDERRKAYLAQLEGRVPAPPQPAPAQREKAAALEAQILSAIKRRDVPEARRALAEAMKLGSTPDLRAFDLWLRYAEKPADLVAVRLELQRLAQSQPGCAQAHHFGGVLARIAGDTEAAEAAFRRTLELVPDHREARQELRLIELRRANNPLMRKR